MIGDYRQTWLIPAFCLLALATAGTAHAQPGTLDPAFNGDGTVIHEIGGEDYGEGNAVFLPGDGELVVIGRVFTYSPFPPPRRGTMTRFNSDGSLGTSPSYGWFSCGETLRAFFAGVRLSNGQYIAAGTRQNSCGGTPRHFDIALINANGQLVNNFDPAPFNNQAAMARAVAVQPDGKIVTAGWDSTNFQVTSTYNAAIARHHADGTLDTGFGTGGEASFDIDGGRDHFESVVLQPDGKIIAAGFATTANGIDFLIMRLHPDGSIDDDFGTDGMVLFDFHGFDDYLREIGLQSDGKIVAAGQSTAGDGSSLQFRVLRFLADGTLDDSFADDGIALIDFGTAGAAARGLAIGPGGRIYLAGYVEGETGNPNSRQAAFAVLRADGTPDPTFANDGKTTFSFGGGPNEIAEAIAVDPAAGHIALSGFSGEFDEDSGRSFVRIAAARLIGIPNSVFADRFEND